MAVNPITGIPDLPMKETVRGPDQALPGTRPQMIGDEELRVEDLIAWLEMMDPLKPVRIVMKTRDSTTESDIFTITENFGEGACVDIFPTRMPKEYKDLRQMLAEKAKALDETTLTDREGQKEEDDECDEAQSILDAIRKRKKARKDADAEIAGASAAKMSLTQYRAAAKEWHRLHGAGRKRERTRGAE